MKVIDSKEVERKNKIAALKNFQLSDNYKSLVNYHKEREEIVQNTICKAYLTPVKAFATQTNEDGSEEEIEYQGSYSEVLKYNTRNKYAWGIQEMWECLSYLDDSEGAQLVKEEVNERISISEEHIGKGLVKKFDGTGMTEYHYSDLFYTESDRLVYKLQIDSEIVSVVDILIKRLEEEKKPSEAKPNEKVNTAQGVSEAEMASLDLKDEVEG